MSAPHISNVLMVTASHLGAHLSRCFHTSLSLLEVLTLNGDVVMAFSSHIVASDDAPCLTYELVPQTEHSCSWSLLVSLLVWVCSQVPMIPPSSAKSPHSCAKSCSSCFPALEVFPGRVLSGPAASGTWHFVSRVLLCQFEWRTLVRSDLSS